MASESRWSNARAGRGLRRRALVAGVIGNLVEWYDFVIYASFVPIISTLFFHPGTGSPRSRRLSRCSA